MDINSELIGILSSSHAWNCCLECASDDTRIPLLQNIRSNTEIIRTAHKESGYMLSDTGTCSMCGGFGEVYCDRIIELQKKSGLTAEEWWGKYPRIVGGSMVLHSAFKFAEGYRLLAESLQKQVEKKMETTKTPTRKSFFFQNLKPSN